MESDHLNCSSPHENNKTTLKYFNDDGIVFPDTSVGDTVQAAPNRKTEMIDPSEDSRIHVLMTQSCLEITQNLLLWNKIPSNYLREVKLLYLLGRRM